MITSICADTQFLYYLDDAVIHRIHVLGSGIDQVIPNPGGTVVELMCTDDFLYARSDTGVYKQHRESLIWNEVTGVPASITCISSSQNYVFIVADGDVYRQDIEGGVFEQMEYSLAATNMQQVDHNHDMTFGLRQDGSFVYYKYGSWHSYLALANADYVMASTNYFYALLSSGDICRSKIDDEGVWEPMGNAGAAVVCIPTNHDDRLWFTDGTVEGLTRYSSAVFSSPGSFDGWVDSDWVDNDWVIV